jgi:hypothetical protein
MAAAAQVVVFTAGAFEALSPNWCNVAAIAYDTIMHIDDILRSFWKCALDTGV